jgi:hypothetical protein
MPSVGKTTAKTNGAAKTAAAGNAAFAVDVSFAGVTPATGMGGQPLPLNRAFKVLTRSVEQTYKKDGSGKITYTFKGEVVEPAEHAGLSFIKTMTDIKNEKAKAFWMTCLLSHGVNRAALEKGSIKFTPAILQGKHAYLYTTPQAGQKYPNTEWLLPELGEKRLAEQPAAEEEPATTGAPKQDEDALFS